MRRLDLALAILILGGCASDGGHGSGAASGGQSKLSADGKHNLQLAQGYMGLGQMARASERANMALKTDPNSADVHALLGVIAARDGDSREAASEFDRALRLAPNSGEILNAHASWLCEQGQAAQADVEFAKALEDAKYRAPIQALANAGKCALTTGDLVKAEGYFRRALEISPEDRAMLYLMADTELRLGKTMEAQAFIQRRDALDDDAETLDLAARIEDAAGNPMAAARYRKRLQLEFPNYVPTGEGAKTP